MRIWHHSFTVLQKLGPYADAMRAHFAKVARPGTEVVMHGMHPDTYLTNYPGNDIQYGYFQTLHAQQFLMGAVAAEEQGFDAFCMMTLPEPCIQECRSLVEIPVVGYGESAMAVAALLGNRIGILAFIGEMLPTLDRNVARIGMTGRYVGAHHVGFGFNDVLAAYGGDPAPLLERFRTAARGLIAKGADVIIPGEAPLCMLLNRAGIAEVDGVPLVDSLAATIKCAEMLVDLRRSTGVTQSKRGYFEATPPRARLKELWKFYGLDGVAP